MRTSAQFEMLQRAVDAKTDPVFLTSKSEIWEYYLDRNKEDRSKAASEAARALSGESSGKAYRNARRNFEGSRTSPKKGDTPKWREFGKQLPPVSRSPKGGEITITVKGKQALGKRGEPRDRKITVTLRGPDAYKFANEPDFRDIWDAYGGGVDDLFEDGDYEIDVYAVV